jgi:hypothetical protein
LSAFLSAINDAFRSLFGLKREYFNFLKEVQVGQYHTLLGQFLKFSLVLTDNTDAEQIFFPQTRTRRWLNTPGKELYGFDELSYTGKFSPASTEKD